MSEPAPEDDDGQDQPKKTQATELVELAAAMFDLGVTEAGDPFAVPHKGPNVALTFRGGRSSLGAMLSKAFYDAKHKAPSAASRADALTVLEGMAHDLEPTEPALRVGRDERDRVVVDLGTPDGWAVVLHRGGYEVLESSPVLFRRTNLTAPMPCPSDGCDAQSLSILRDCGMNMVEKDWRLFVGFLVASLIPDIPHPILALFGEQGTGKSTAGRLIAQLVDPSAAPLRTAPRNEEAWAVQAAGSWVVVLDNVSTIQPWLSDAMSRAVTGDGYVRRTLYSNADVSVLSFRRVLVMTSIDAGALRGDLAERLLPLELQRIDTTQRLPEADLLSAFNKHRPQILGGLFGITAQVLEALPHITLTESPRMADFARVLAALDEVTGWTTLADFAGVADDLASDVVAADPVASAIVELMANLDYWTGTASELLAAISTDERTRTKGWPGTARSLVGCVKRAAVALRSAGIDADQGPRTGNTRPWILSRCEEGCIQPSQPSQPSQPAPLQASSRDGGRDGSDGDEAQPSQPSLVPSRPDPSNDKANDGHDGSDGRLQYPSQQTVPMCSKCGKSPAASFRGGLCIHCPVDEVEVPF